MIVGVGWSLVSRRREASRGTQQPDPSDGEAASGGVARGGPGWPPFPSTTRSGGVLLLLIALTGLAGIPMALRYDVDPASAHGSVTALAQGLWGWVRGVHVWAASLVLVAVLLHPLSTWVRRRDLRIPARIWVSGVVLLAAILATWFSGTILRFDHRSWEALEHLEQGVNVVGLSLIGEGDPGNAPLGLFFLVHVFAVPFTLVALLAVHLARSRKARQLGTRIVRFVRDAARPAGVLAGVVVLLALVAPPRLGPAPVAGLEVTSPPWPFLWLVPLQDLMGALGLWVLPLLLVLLLVAPWVAPRWSRRSRGVVAAVVLVSLLVLTVLGGGFL